MNNEDNKTLTMAAAPIQSILEPLLESLLESILGKSERKRGYDKAK